MDISQITTQSELREAVKGRSDKYINEVVGDQGATVVMRVAEQMKEHFLPEKAKGREAVIQYDVAATDGVHTFHLEIADGRCQVAAGQAASPRITLKVALAPFLRLSTGELSAMSAFLSGKVKVKGDLMIGPLIETWFRFD